MVHKMSEQRDAAARLAAEASMRARSAAGGGMMHDFAAQVSPLLHFLRTYSASSGTKFSQRPATI